MRAPVNPVLGTEGPAHLPVEGPRPRGGSRGPRSRAPEPSQGTVVLIGCSAAKLGHAAPARDLYTSQLFRMSRAYCEARGDEWAILSVLHGLVLPGQGLEPYDVNFMRLRAAGANAIQGWAARTRMQLDVIFPGARFVLVAGSDYRGAIAHLPAHRREEPLAGLQIGERQSWLKRQTLHLKARRATS